MNPLISIIIPVYKVEKYLPKCIESILSQTFTNFELLLIDDGSPDNSGKICDKYQKKDSRIKVFHQSNKGVSAARNLGLNKANGEWIAFCDSDDWVEIDWLESYTNIILNNNFDIIFQGYISENKNKSSTHYLKNSSQGYLDAIYLLEKEDLLGWTCCKILKRSIIQQHRIQFEESLSLSEDLLFTLKFCIYANSLFVLPLAKYHYVSHSDSLINKIYSYEELYKRNILIRDARLLLLNKHKYSVETEYENFIKEKYYADIIHSLKSVYKKEPLRPFSERIQILHSTKKMNEFTSFLNRQDKLLTKALKLYPCFILDNILICLSFINKFKGKLSRK